MPESRSALPGSSRPDVAAEQLAGPLDAATTIEATVVLRRKAQPPAEAFGGTPLSRAELAERYGADPADVDAVTHSVTTAGAEVVSSDPASRTVRIRGTAAVLGELFGTSLQAVGADVPGTRRRSGELSVPSGMSGVVTAVLGLDDRPQARARFRSSAAQADSVSYTPLQLASAYNFPDGDGSGQYLAIVELGGGYGHDDLNTYFEGLGITPPKVSAHGVDGAKNVAGQDPNGADGEVLLDIEVAGAVAPGAHLVVYFAPNSDAGFVDAITHAAHATHTPTAISISWGQSEDQWTPQARVAMDSAFADAALLGVTVTAAAGDDGSSDRQPDSAPHADFPASSPHALGCGGTALHLDASGTIMTETVWNDGGQGGATGGGVSDTFPLPSWQENVGVPKRAAAQGTAGRGVPDVAAVADPQTGYVVRVDGHDLVIGGTSAVAPLMAGLACRLAQAVGHRLGLLQPTIYAAASAGGATPGFRDITEGSNGAYDAAAGWDPCTGLGVPDGKALLAVVTAAAPAS